MELLKIFTWGLKVGCLPYEINETSTENSSGYLKKVDVPTLHLFYSVKIIDGLSVLGANSSVLSPPPQMEIGYIIIFHLHMSMKCVLLWS